MQVLGARGLCHPLHNSLWDLKLRHPILKSRGSISQRETFEVCLFALPGIELPSSYLHDLLSFDQTPSSAFFKSPREILDGDFVTLVKQG